MPEQHKNTPMKSLKAGVNERPGGCLEKVLSENEAITPISNGVPSQGDPWGGDQIQHAVAATVRGWTMTGKYNRTAIRQCPSAPRFHTSHNAVPHAHHIIHGMRPVKNTFFHSCWILNIAPRIPGILLKEALCQNNEYRSHDQELINTKIRTKSSRQKREANNITD
jgi:hypothetical protein